MIWKREAPRGSVPAGSAGEDLQGMAPAGSEADPTSSRKVLPVAGDAVLLRRDGGETQRARVHHTAGRRCELSLRPRPGSAEIEPPTQGELELRLSRADAVYCYRAAVLPGSTGQRLVLLLSEATPKRVQRREYFRMRLRLPLMLRLTSWLLFPIVDLSGGGCLCLDPGRKLRPGRTYEGRMQIGREEHPLRLRVRVVRRTRIGGRPAAGLCFEEMRDVARQRIMAALFREYRARRAGGAAGAGRAGGASAPDL